jgi:Protein of unknown function (DUF3168)
MTGIFQASVFQASVFQVDEEESSEMKDIRLALRTYLLADPTISGLVGGVRIHHVRLPQDQVEPSVVYTRISEVGDYNMVRDSGLGQVRVQLDSWAQNSDAANELSNAVYDRITGARDTMSSIIVKGIFMAGGRDDYDEVSQLYRASRDYIVWYGAST